MEQCVCMIQHPYLCFCGEFEPATTVMLLKVYVVVLLDFTVTRPLNILLIFMHFKTHLRHSKTQFVWGSMYPSPHYDSHRQY